MPSRKRPGTARRRRRCGDPAGHRRSSRPPPSGRASDRSGRKRPVRVRADDKLLGQAITTFIINALEAMPEGRGASRRPWAFVALWQISVADTAAASWTFSTRLLSLFHPPSRGLGLGLVLARGIVERFGGCMAVASTEGEGDGVRIELRAA